MPTLSDSRSNFKVSALGLIPPCQLLTIVTLDGTFQKGMAGRSRSRSDRSPGNADIRSDLE